MLLDFLQPIKYFLEKSVVNKIIPDVSQVPHRKQLKDYPLQEEGGDTTTTTTTTFDHSKWTAVLQRHVQTNVQLGDIEKINVVDYDGLAQDADYQDYLGQLAASKPEELPPREQLAFWINAYNALCINLIVSHERTSNEPLKSINNLSKPNNPVWDQVAGQVAGHDITLNEIEHDRLRNQWNEPVVHACIVCASASCPNLRQEAYTAPDIETQMQDQMRDWLSNRTKGLVLKGNNRLELSRIFLWFEKDFGGYKGIREWIPQFVQDETVAEKIKNGQGVTLRYFEYDWSINRSPKQQTKEEE